VVFPHGSISRVVAALAARGTRVSRTTVWNDLQAMGKKAYVRSKSSRLTNAHRKGRVDFCKRLLRQPRVLARLVMSDEKFFTGKQSGRLWQWVPRGGYVLPRPDEQGGPSQLVWGCLGPYGFLRLRQVVLQTLRDEDEGTRRQVRRETMTRDKYEKSVLPPVLRELRDKDYVLQQDGAAAHEGLAKAAAQGRRWAGVEVLPHWPANSPDLSVIETVWALLARAVRHEAPWGEGQIWEAVERCAASIPRKTLVELHAEIAVRLQLCVELRGAVVTRNAVKRRMKELAAAR
jgi:hypothetical protein